MKTAKALMLIPSATLWLCVSLVSVQAKTYRYEFIVTDVVYGGVPPSSYSEYLDLTASSGGDVPHALAIADWSLVTPYETLDNGNSYIVDSPGPELTWNPTTITGMDAFEFLPDGEVPPETKGAIFFADNTDEQVLVPDHSPFPEVEGYWKAVSVSSVPDNSSTIGLTILGLVGLFCFRLRFRYP